VLVRPRDPNNIGAAARAMKNFGFRDLAVVTPHAPVWNEVVSAVNAVDVLTNARVCDSLAEAIAECTLVIGTKDRTAVEWKQTLFTPRDLHEKLQRDNHRFALVFGPEKHGLTNADLALCHQTMSIPTQPNCPSMNLGQAVAVCCYELVREAMLQTVRNIPAEKSNELATAGEIEQTLQMMVDALDKAEFLLPGNETAIRNKLRQSLLRFALTNREIRLLCGALRQINAKL
jgi:tRNA/rRNA methyltransferase